LTQSKPGVQCLPHAPQLFMSLLIDVHPLPHQVIGGSQVRQLPQ
jgi:hypothetical protein